MTNTQFFVFFCFQKLLIFFLRIRVIEMTISSFQHPSRRVQKKIIRKNLQKKKKFFSYIPFPSTSSIGIGFEPGAPFIK
jgi:hypothetical protein